MLQEEHDDLELYLEEYIRQAKQLRWSYDWFMKNNYFKLVNDTLSDLIEIDIDKAGL